MLYKVNTRMNGAMILLTHNVWNDRHAKTYAKLWRLAILSNAKPGWESRSGAWHVLHVKVPCSGSNRLFMKGARHLEFDKLREICGDYQQLSYAKGTCSVFVYD